MGPGTSDAAPIAWLKRILIQRGELVAIVAVFGAAYYAGIRGSLDSDEVFYAYAGAELFKGNPYTNPTHVLMPLPKVFIGLGQVMFGEGTFGARFFGPICGVATLAATYELGRRIGNRWIGAAAATATGCTLPFAGLAASAMLDPYVAATFALLLLAATSWQDSPGRRTATTLGALAMATAATKAYAVVLAAVPLAWMVAVTWHDPGRRHTWIHVGQGIAGVAAILYAPFLFMPHPPLSGEVHVPSFAKFLLAIPVLGNLAFAAAMFINVNLGHLGAGHAIVVAGTRYQTAPAWSYAYWMAIISGPALIAGTVAAAAAAWKPRLLGIAGRRWLPLALLVPLAFLSLQSVKFPRYLVPFVGALYILAALAAWRLAEQTPRRFRRPATTGSLILVVAAGLTLGAASVPGFTDISSESGYPDALAIIAEQLGKTNLTLLAQSPWLVDYYWAQQGGWNGTVALVGYHNDGLAQEQTADIEAGHIDAVIDTATDRRYLNHPLIEVIRNNTVQEFAVDHRSGWTGNDDPMRIFILD